MSGDVREGTIPDVVQHILTAQGVAEAVKDAGGPGARREAVQLLTPMLADATLQLARAAAEIDQDLEDLADYVDQVKEAAAEDRARLAEAVQAKADRDDVPSRGDHQELAAGLQELADRAQANRELAGRKASHNTADTLTSELRRLEDRVEELEEELEAGRDSRDPNRPGPATVT